MTPYLFPLAIVCGIVAMIYYARWRAKSEDAKTERRTDELIAAVVAVKLERYPELAAAFTRYIRECFRVDLSQMDFKQHITYVGKHLKKFRRRDYSRYFPGGEGEFVAAVSANLGEVIAGKYRCHWEQDSEAPFFPFLAMELNNGKKTCCSPEGAVITQIVSGDDTQAIMLTLLPFEKTDAVEAKVTECFDSICVDDDKTELELNPKFASNMRLTRCVAYGVCIGCIVIPVCFLAFDQVNSKTLGLLALGMLAAVILIGTLIQDRWAAYVLPKHSKLVMKKDGFSLTGDLGTVDVAYREVIHCKHGIQQSPVSAPEMILKLKTARRKIALSEGYFSYPAGARMVLSEIAKRIEDAKQGENHA